MVYREFITMLEKHGVKKVETVGEPFDPKIHEAVAVVPHDEYDADTVVEHVCNGYTRAGKLLRPASVVVSR
jgi:molecular chaperone GrpE